MPPMYAVWLAVLLSAMRLGDFASAPAAFSQSFVAAAASDDGILAVWLDQRMGPQPFSPSVVFATRISASGEILDPYGIRLSTQAVYEPPVLVAWGGDAYLVVTNHHSQFHVQKVGKNGRPLHEPFPILPTGQYGDALHLASNGNGFLFIGSNSDTETTFAAWLDKDGRVKRKTDLHGRFTLSATLVVHRGVYHYYYSQLESLSPDTLRAAYLTTLRDDGVVEKRQIRAPGRSNPYVAAASNGDEIFVVISDSARDDARLAWDGSAFLLYWSEPARVVGVRFDRQGRAIDPSPFVLPSATLPVFARTGSTSALLWQDDRFSEDADVAGIAFAGFGDLVARAGEARLIAKSSRPQENIRFATNGEKTLAVWREAGRPPKIQGAFMGEQAIPFTIASASTKSITELAIAYGSGFYLVMWKEPAPSWGAKIMAVRVSDSGKVIDAEPREIGGGFDGGYDELSIASDGTSFVAAWRTSVYDLTAVHIDAALNVVEIPIDMPERGMRPQPNIPPPDPRIHRALPRIVFDGTDFVVAWTESRHHVDPFQHLRVMRVSRDGALLGDTKSETPAHGLVARNGEVIAFRTESNCLTATPLGGGPTVTLTCGAPGYVNWISAVPVEDAYVAVWMRDNGGQYDVHAARFTLAGEVELFDLGRSAENERRPSVILHDGKPLFGYERVAADEGFVPRLVLRTKAVEPRRESASRIGR